SLCLFYSTVADFVLGGLLSNSFITAMIIKEWAKSRNLAQLLLSLGISNIFATVLLMLDFFTLNESATISKSLMMQLYFSISTYAVFMRLWLTAWLCVFYCVKILNSTHSFFLWWKMRISGLVPRLIMGSCVLSFLASFFIVLSISKQLQSNGTANITNISQEGKVGENWKNSDILVLTVASSCPLLIVFLCSTVVVVSLCRHICNMTSEGSNLRNLQTEAHVKAARTVLSLLILYISYDVAQTMSIVLGFKRKPVFQMCVIVMLMYAPVQAAILVLSNPKLKQTASQMLARTKS
uniref:Taste receptor type 2 n=1 Tax=Salvator merianae TaxID=96440 RepID=A0A8D0BUZ5_SALMN